MTQNTRQTRSAVLFTCVRVNCVAASLTCLSGCLWWRNVNLPLKAHHTSVHSKNIILLHHINLILKQGIEHLKKNAFGKNNNLIFSMWIQWYRIAQYQIEKVVRIQCSSTHRSYIFLSLDDVRGGVHGHRGHGQNRDGDSSLPAAWSSPLVICGKRSGKDAEDLMCVSYPCSLSHTHSTPAKAHVRYISSNG